MSLKYYNNPWWVGCLLVAATGCCAHGPLIAFPPPLVIDRGCPALLAPVLASPQSPGPVIRSVPLTVTPPPPPDAEVLPPELPGSITVPSLTPGEPLPHAEPGPRPTFGPANRPGRRKLLVLDGAGGVAG